MNFRNSFSTSLFLAAVLFKAGEAQDSTASRQAPSPAEPPPSAPAKEEVPAKRDPRRYVLALDGKEVPLSETPLAVTVLTGDDLRALGVHTLPEAFRYVPGVDAYQLNGFTYAVGIRGVDDEFNPRIHVYLDGRLVNVPEFGGVDWESIPVSVDDIERIEIIRAAGVDGEAGSSLQGTIRIWTKRPRGTSLATYSGYLETRGGQIHFGRLAGKLGPFEAKLALEYRTDDGVAGQQISGGMPLRSLDDGEDLIKINALLGWRIAEDSQLDLRFGGLHGRVDESSGDPISNGLTDTRNDSVHARWAHRFEGGIRLVLGYYFEDFDLRVRDHPSAPLHNAGDDIDLERTTHALYADSRIPLVPEFFEATVGGGWKKDSLRFERNDPSSDRQEIFHAHLDGELRPLDPLILSAGVEFEEDRFAGFDVSPRAGAVFKFLPGHSLRASYRVGRRKPNFSEVDIAFVVPNPMPPPATLPLITGNPDLDRETVDSYEIGYRAELDRLGLLFDAQLFVQEIEDKVIFVPDPASPLPAALTFDNAGDQRAGGAELYAEWRVLGPLTVYGTYTWLNVEDTNANKIVRDRPRHRVNVGARVRFDDDALGILDGVSAAVNLNYTSRIVQADASGVRHTLGDTFRLDLRVAKAFLDDRVEIALIGRNLLDSDTVEFRPALGSNFNGDFGAERMILINLLVRLP